MTTAPDPFRALPTGWSEAEWSAFEDWLRIEGFAIHHCAHDDRNTDHPSCVIVAVAEEKKHVVTDMEQRHHLVRVEPAAEGMCGVRLGDDHTPVFCQNDATVTEICRWCGVGPEVAFYRCDVHRSEERS